MATVNKASLRTEFEALKARCAALCADGRMTPEGRALFEAMLMLFELLLAVFPEKTAPRGTRNSGLPSSRTDPDETARGHTGARGKGPDSRAAGVVQPAGWSRPALPRSPNAGPAGITLKMSAPAAMSGACRSISSLRPVS